MAEETLTSDAPVKLYDGPPATPDNFTTAFPEFDIKKGKTIEAPGAGRMGTAPQRGLRPLDVDSQRRMDEAYRQIRTNRPKPATVINLHSFELAFPSTNQFLRGIRVPACKPGEPFAFHHIRTTSLDKSYKEDGTFEFSPIIPIQKAAQFLVAFADPEVYGGGVIVYEGDRNPDNVEMVETYGPTGLANCTQMNGYEEGDEGEKIPVVIPVPIKKNLHEMISEQRAKRNEKYLREVEHANELWGAKEPHIRREVIRSPKYRLMAEMLLAEGLLKEKHRPDWMLASATDVFSKEERTNQPVSAAVPLLAAATPAHPATTSWMPWRHTLTTPSSLNMPRWQHSPRSSVKSRRKRKTAARKKCLQPKRRLRKRPKGFESGDSLRLPRYTSGLRLRWLAKPSRPIIRIAKG